MSQFQIIFQGRLSPGVSPVEARQRIGQLFQVGEAQLDVLFSGRRIVIKQGLDAAAAQKYQLAIERAGALCQVEPPLDVAPSASESAPQPQPQIQPEQPISRGPAPRDEFMAAFRDVEAPDFGIAPLGADLQDEYSSHTPLPLDLSALSLAPVGSDMGEMQKPEPPPAPDTSHLKLKD